MQSQAKTVPEYLASLPEDRRHAIETLRNVILENIDKDFEEGMQYGMLGYYVPHSLYPEGYHCDPKQPLNFAALASQKNHMALYAMFLYMDPKALDAFTRAWKATGKKLDMGKACIRFKKLEDVPLEVIGQTFRSMSCAHYLQTYVGMLGPKGKPVSDRAKGDSTKGTSKAKSGAKKVGAKKTATKATQTGAPSRKPAATKKAASNAKASKAPAKKTIATKASPSKQAAPKKAASKKAAAKKVAAKK